MDEKEKKITQLRSLLAKAKGKIEELILSVGTKEKQLSELKIAYEKKNKQLEIESGQIVKQYQQRFLRYQKSLEDSDNLVKKYQAQAITSSASNQQTSQALALIGSITMRIFTLNKVKDSSEAVEQLCNIQKCNEFISQIDKIQKNEDLTPVFKSIAKLTDMVVQGLTKKREARLGFVKREAQMKKMMEEEIEKNTVSMRRSNESIIQYSYGDGNSIEESVHPYLYSELQYRQKLDESHRNATKKSQQVTNLQFIKQLMLKIFVGPKQAASMALEVLTKVLKMNEEELRICGKNIR